MNHQHLAPDLPTRNEVDDLEVRLQARLGGRIRNLQIVPHEGGLLLRGSARTYHAKQLAQHVLMSETTLPILANEIEVY